MKKLPVALAIALFSAGATASPVFGNHVGATVGTSFSQDKSDLNDIDDLSVSDLYLKVNGAYFIDENLYAFGLVQRTSIKFDDTDFDETTTLSVTTFGGGVGYEMSFADNISGFAQGGIGLNNAKVTFDDGNDTFSFTDSSTSILVTGGVRASLDAISLEGALNFVSSEGNSDTSLAVAGFYSVTQDILVGADLETDTSFDVKVVSAALRYKY